MNTLTLKYGSDERFLADWGISMPKLQLLSQAVSRMTFPVPGADPATVDAFEIPYKGLCSVYMDRVSGGGGFSGGTLIFQGRRSDIEGMADPARPALNFVLSDPWWDLEQVIFQHFWQVVTSISSGVPTYGTQYFSQLNLFQDISAGPGAPWTTLSTDRQIAQIVTFANGSGANVQLGACDPAWNLPVFPVKNITCAAAVLHCLSLVPNAVTFFDYSTSPPTLHIRQRPNCTAVTMPFGNGPTTDGSPMHKSSRLRPLSNLQASQVVLQYRKNFNYNGGQSTNLLIDSYPVASNGRSLGAIVAAVDLRGGVLNTVSGVVTSTAIDPTTPAFWQNYKCDLADASITGLTVLSDSAHPIKVTDSSGTDLTSTWAANWPNAISTNDSTGLAPWMPIQVKDVTISGWVSYTQKNTLGSGSGSASVALHKPEAHPVSVRLKITNSPAGSQPYSTVAQYDPGETAPGWNFATSDFRTPGSLTNDGKGGVAYLIWSSMQQLQYEGTHSIVQESITKVAQGDITGGHAIISPGNVLNLSGGATGWATMNAVITRVDVDFFRGTTEINLGPEKHLGPAEIVERILMWRYRIVYDDPNVRNTGHTSTATNVQLQTDSPKENTVEGLNQNSLHTVVAVQDGSGNQAFVQNNAGTSAPVSGISGPGIVMGTMDNTGAPKVDSTHGLLKLLLADAGGQTVKFRVVQFTDETGATAYAMLVAGAKQTSSIGTPDFTIAGSGGMRWKDTYNSGTAYSQNDVVRVLSGSSQGIWINVKSGGSTGVDPVWPEPTTPTWKLIAFGAQTTNACISGSPGTVYVNASQGF